MEEKTLTELLGEDSKTELFKGVPFQAKKPSKPEPPKPQKIKTPSVPEDERMVFVGNIPLDCKKKQIKQLMSSIGEIEKV